MQEEKRRVLLEENIVSFDTACASFPLQLVIHDNNKPFSSSTFAAASSSSSLTGPHTYHHQFSSTFFDSNWPLGFNPRPLRCEVDVSTGVFTYFSSTIQGRRQKPVFTLRPTDDISPPDFARGQRTFDCVMEFRGRAFRVVQSLMPPLLTPDPYTPVLTGGENKPTAKNMQPSFVYNADLGLVELSPPVFRALSLFFFAENDNLANQPDYSPCLYASFLVALPELPAPPYKQKPGRPIIPRKTMPYYCVLQFLEAPPLQSTRLCQMWNNEMNTTLPPLTCNYLLPFLYKQATSPPYFLPHPVDVAQIFLKKESLEIVAFDSYSFGSMGIPVSATCRSSFATTSTQGRTRLQDGNQPLKRFLEIRSKSARDQTMKTIEILPVFARPWVGEMTWLPEQVIKTSGGMSVTPRWSQADSLRDVLQYEYFMINFNSFILHLPNIMTLDQANTIMSWVHKVFINNWDGSQSKQQENSAAVLLSLPMLKDTTRLATINTFVQPCKEKNACSVVQPPFTDYVSDFKIARNMLKLRRYSTDGPQPNAFMFSVNHLFSAFLSSSTIFRSLRPNIPNLLFYPDVLDSLCHLRIKTDAVHFYLSRTTLSTERVQTVHGYDYYESNCVDLQKLTLVLELYLVAGSIFVQLLDQIIDTASMLARRMTKFLGGVFSNQLCFLAKQMLLVVNDMDKKQRQSSSSSFGGPSSQVFAKFRQMMTMTLQTFFPSTTTHPDQHVSFPWNLFQQQQHHQEEDDDDDFYNAMHVDDDSSVINIPIEVDVDSSDTLWMQTFVESQTPREQTPNHRNHLLAYTFGLYAMACWFKNVCPVSGRLVTAENMPLAGNMLICLQSMSVFMIHLNQVLFSDIRMFRGDYETWKKSVLGSAIPFFEQQKRNARTWKTMLAANTQESGSVWNGFAGSQNPLVWRNIFSTTAPLRPYLLLDSILDNSYPSSVYQDTDLSDEDGVDLEDLIIQLVTKGDVDSKHPLAFTIKQKLGQGSYGEVFSGQVSLPADSGLLSLPVAFKVQDIRAEHTSWNRSLQALAPAPHSMEVICMTMLHRYGRWEEDPYIVSPIFYWTGSVAVPVQKPNSYETVDENRFVIIMESFEPSVFTNLWDWMRDDQILQTSKDIVMERLNAYFDYMAYESPICLQMQDNKINNILIEKHMLVNPRTALIALIDQAMSMVSVPLDDFLVLEDQKGEDEDESMGPSLSRRKALLRRDAMTKVRDKKLTFVDNRYESSGLIPPHSMQHNRIFSPLERPGPGIEYTIKQVGYEEEE